MSSRTPGTMQSPMAPWGRGRWQCRLLAVHFFLPARRLQPGLWCTLPSLSHIDIDIDIFIDIFMRMYIFKNMCVYLCVFVCVFMFVIVFVIVCVCDCVVCVCVGGGGRGRGGGGWVGGWVLCLSFARLILIAVALKITGAQQLHQVKRMIGGLGNMLLSVYSQTENV